MGKVDDIEVGKVSRERLYRIKYQDGDLEHLTAEQVRECMVNVEEPKAHASRQNNASPKPQAEPKTSPLKKPASAMTMADVIDNDEEAAEDEDEGEDEGEEE